MRAALLLVPLLLQQAPAPAPGPARPGPPVAAGVVAAVAKAAGENAALPAERRVAGDALGDLYVRRAAAASEGDAMAFLVGLAHAVDPKATLARHPLTAAAFAGIETPEEGKARAEVLGKPTLRGRNDLLLHFAGSAALAAAASPRAAEAAGIAKETADSRGGTGFSFADLLADLAGVRFASWLAEKETKARLEKVAAGFSGEAFLPDPSKEPEGLREEEFARRYGTASDERFLAKVKELRAAVDGLAAYREEAKVPAPK